jgi:ATP-dependent helicase HrpB
MRLPELPITEALPALRGALASASAAVLQAPPGAGKSTVVPLALLDEPWVRGRKILMLEPRRVAARGVAQRMAATLGESVGATVGYRMRLDTRVSRATRIEVITEGVLTRMLQTDPTLEDVAAVLFDEFHERSLQADLGLALCLDARRTLDSDLRLLVMSATLDGVAVAALLGEHTPIVTSQGRAFPVTIEYVGSGLPLLPGGGDLERAVTSTTRRALRETEGDVLVFLPGAAEIRRVRDMLGAAPEVLQQGVLTFPLYGDLDPAAQEAALAFDPKSPRRVILSTNIAETSVTLPGIRVVVDAGLVRRSVFDPVSGMSRLETQRISRASADQRAGRAGRVAAGRCYRLWSEGAQRSLAAFARAEILEADLAPLALDLAEWGTTEASVMPWLDTPPPATLDGARDLLSRLGALDAAGRITAHGRALAHLPMHPRLAHLLIEAQRRGVLSLGAKLAALLSERDLLRGRAGDVTDLDVTTRLDLLDSRFAGGEVDRGAWSRIREAAKQYERRMDASAPQTAAMLDAAGLLACAYPDRIGKRRAGSDGRFLLANGRGAHFARTDRLASAEYLVAVDLDDRDREARIQLAAAIDRPMLEQAAGARLQTVDEVAWSTREQCVVMRRLVKLDALIIDERPLMQIDPEHALQAMLDGIAEMGLDCLPWDEVCRSFCARVELARRLELPDVASWPVFAADALLVDREGWLAPWLSGVTRRSHLAKLPLLEMLQHRLGHAGVRKLDEWLPSHLGLPTGSRVRIDYQGDLAPSASMRMQEVFGLAATPRLALGKLPVTFQLLSPAQRPLQVTADLASFWRNAYVEVRKDMRGRYPRHHWPENPLEAEPVRGVKKRT